MVCTNVVVGVAVKYDKLSQQSFVFFIKNKLDVLFFLFAPNFPSHAICSVLNCGVVLQHRGLRIATGVTDQRRGPCKYTHVLELKPVSSAATPGWRCNTHTSGVIQGLEVREHQQPNHNGF